MGGSSKSVTVGYKYYVGMHMVLCRGPVDYLKEALVDDKVLIAGDLTSGTYAISKEDLFGGESREGGVSGLFDVMNGESTQTVNSYLSSKLGSLVPAFRGVLSVVLRQMYLGINPYLKKWSFVASRIHVRQNGLAQWYDEKAEIPGITVTYSDYQSSWEYQIGAENVTSPPVPNPATLTPPSSGWSITTAPFGVANVTPWDVPFPIATNWPARRILWVRKIISVPNIDGSLRIGIYYENSCFVYWDGAYIGGLNVTNAQITASLYGEVVIPAELVTAGSHELAIMGMDEDQPASGSNTYLAASVFNVSGNVDMPDMNPAHIIRECLTDPDWGMGYAEADMDDASFTAAADTLYEEGMGMSLLWDTQISIEEFVQLVCKHINASIYVDRKTGLFVLKLIRQDYDEEDLLILNPSNVSKVQDFSRVQFGELVNSITVSYWNSAVRNASTLTVTDIALASTQGATINTSVKYEGFTNADIASRVAQRDLKALSTPLISCTVYANTDAANLNIGDCFKLSWPDYDISEVIMRVATIGYGDGKSNRVRLTCTQDVFAMPNVSYIAPTPPEGIVTDAAPVPVTARIAFELPYLEAVQQMGQSVVDGNLATNSDIAYFAIAAGRPSSNSLNARLYTDAGGGYQDQSTVDFCPFASVVANFDRNATSFDIENLQDFSEIQLGSWFQLGSELMSISSISGATINVKRGLLDTVPVEHSAGEVLFFWDLYAGEDSTQYVSGETVSGKLATVTGSGVLALSSAPADSVTMVGRMFKPYAPGNVQINGAYFPKTIDYGDVSLSWAHRDRKQQTGADYVGFLENSIGPEIGTTYNLAIYGEDNNLLRQETAISGTSYVYDTATEAADSGGSAAIRPYYNKIMALAPTAYYEFDEETGIIANDSSGNSHNGTYSSGVTLAQAPAIAYGHSVSFNGTSGYVNCDGVLSNPSIVTVMVWRKAGAISISEVLFGHRSTSSGVLIQLSAQSNSELRFQLRSSSSSLIELVKTGLDLANNDYFLVGVLNKTTNLHKFYVNGVLQATNTTNFGSSNFSSTKQTFGASHNGSTYFVFANAKLDEGAIFNGSEIAAADILELFNLKTVNETLRLNGRLRFVLESERDGTASFQAHDITCERFGYGINYGNFYGGV